MSKVLGGGGWPLTGGMPGMLRRAWGTAGARSSAGGGALCRTQQQFCSRPLANSVSLGMPLSLLRLHFFVGEMGKIRMRAVMEMK